ncbi:MAG: lipid-binding SYLF domain-containing protein [Desulfobacterales bacterium]|nr:lipid-binding SYLF domain-containing protein [Desulfobacterales bacterium]
MSTMYKSTVASLVVSFLFLFSPVSLSAETYTEAHLLVDNGTTTLQQFIADPNMKSIGGLARRAQGILIIPQMLRGGFVVGGTGGSGILLARNQKTQTWQGPAFYTIGSVTFGLQIGAEASQVVMLIMTSKGLNTMLSSSFKLGAEVTIAAGPIGGGAKAATADILAYSRSKGAFGGFTVEGAVMQTKDGWNTSYFGEPATPVEILISEGVTNKHADDIKNILSKVAAPTSQKVKY